MRRKCISCGENWIQIEQTEMCAPCTFGEADSLSEWDPVEYEGSEEEEEE